MKDISSRSWNEFKNLEILLFFALILAPTKNVFQFSYLEG